MSVFEKLRTFLNRFFEKKGETVQPIYEKTDIIQEVHSIWDYIKFTGQSQAHHICSVLGFEEWVSMNEILRRTKELFRVEYKNERSLYPYIKTLVDCGLLETTGFGGKKHWRKKDLIIKLEKEKESVKIKESATIKN